MNKLISIAPLRDAMFEYTRSYDNWGSDYSVTQLLRPPRIVQLEKRYKDYFDALPFDDDAIRKSLSSFKGTAIHSWFEKMLWKYINRNPNCGYIMERRIWDRIRDRKISGKFDCYRNGALYDYKTTSVWKRIYGQFDDYEKQLNLYAYLLGTCGIHVSILFIIAWYMDWQKTKQYQKDYPREEIEQIHIEGLWPVSEQQDYLYHLIDRQKANEDRPDDELDECEAEDMWSKDTTYAVTYPGATRAVRVKDTYEDAQSYIDWAKGKEKDTKKLAKMDNWYVETRSGERTRCGEYCRVNCFCNQYKRYCEEQGLEVPRAKEVKTG